MLLDDIANDPRKHGTRFQNARQDFRSLRDFGSLSIDGMIEPSGSFIPFFVPSLHRLRFSAKAASESTKIGFFACGPW